jgi:hypothetical protein
VRRSRYGGITAVAAVAVLVIAACGGSAQRQASRDASVSTADARALDAPDFTALQPAGFTDVTPKVGSGLRGVALRGPVADGLADTIRAGTLGPEFTGSIASIAAQFQQIDRQQGYRVDSGPLARVTIDSEPAVAFATTLTRAGRPGHERLVIVRHRDANYAFGFTAPASAYARDLEVLERFLASVRWKQRPAG